MDQEMPEQAAPQAYKTEIISDKITYEVLENGDVKVKQDQKLESFWKSRDFTSLLRQNEEALKMFKDAQSKEHIEKMQTQEQKVQDVLDEIKPVAAESEKEAEEDYKKLRHEGLLKNLRSALDDKETNLNWFQQIWLRAKDELKTPIYKELSKEHQDKLMKILHKMKRKGAQ